MKKASILAQRYEILEPTGQGTFGQMYKARDKRLNRLVAVKVLAPYLLGDPQFVAQFGQEAELLAKLDHPHIVRVYDAETAQESAYIVMQFVEGQDLAEALAAEKPPWPPERVLALLRQVAAALDYAHSQGVLHLDLKPANVLLGEEGHVWLTDFGLARAVAGASRASLTQVVQGGTPAYMAPEQVDLENPREVTPATDIYALAVVAYELLTGRVPFVGQTQAVVHAHVSQQPPRPTLLNEALSQGVEDVLLRGLAKAPEARFPTAQDFVDALTKAFEADPVRGPRPRRVRGEPLALGEMRVYTLQDFVQAADSAWEAAVDALHDGSLEAWLRQIRALGAAEAARRLREAYADQRGEARERALEEFLQWTGYVTEPTLSVQPPVVDFGAEEKGYGYRVLADVIITNAGRGLVWGKVEALAPWVDVVEGARFFVRAGEQHPVLVEADVDALPNGVTEVDAALAVRSSVGDRMVRARVEVLGPEASLEPAVLDFGRVQGEERRELWLRVSNRGHGALEGTVHVDVPRLWLQVSPPAFRCPAGREALVRVVLDPAGLPVAARAVEAQFVLKTNAGTFTVPVRAVNSRTVEKGGDRGFWAILQALVNSRTVEEEAVEVLEPELVYIPPGPFTMGSEDGDSDEKPVHTVELPEYWIGKYPVTNEEYACFVRATGHRAPEHWEGKEPPQGKEEHPVVYVSWHDAMAYCRWLAEVTGKPYRLPTEAEWEKAARGTDGRVYPWGDEWDPSRCNSKEQGPGTTTPVGQYPRGASPYGVLDMAGNVWEWTSSLDKPYPYRADDGREDPRASGSRAVRGGAWYNDPRDVRAAARGWDGPDDRDGDQGFRVVAAPR